MKGEAEAFAIEAKAKAESEQMCKKADAWKEYEDAAKIEMMLDIIPKVTVLFCSLTSIRGLATYHGRRPYFLHLSLPSVSG